MTEFVAGAVAMLACVAGLFFLRFWRKSRDRFFGFFALAFWLMALQRALIILVPSATEHRASVYSVRLLAFVVILVAILDKNRARPRGPRPHGEGPG
jgi:uncharacterized membrane protein